MDALLPPHLDPHLVAIRAAVAADPRFLGLAGGGSLTRRGMDEFSDLDLVVVVADEHHASVMTTMTEIVGSWGARSAFRGDHVGEPRLVIAMFERPLAHVDLKFVKTAELADRTEEPVVIWERSGVVTRVIAGSRARSSALDEQWIEDRFWTWVHYAATKLGRGELFEVLEFLSFLRSTVLAPLARTRRGLSDNGVRRVEQAMPDAAEAWRSTAARHDAVECAAAIRQCVEAYRDLRGSGAPHVRVDAGLEAACVDYLEHVAQRWDPATTPRTGARQVASPHVNDEARSASPPR